MRGLALIAQVAQYPALRTEPVKPWWAEMVPWIALALVVGSFVVAIAFLPRLLQGGMGGAAMIKALLGDGKKETSPPGVDLNPGSAPSSASANPGEVDGEAVQEPAPTWVGMDFDIFNEDVNEDTGSPANTAAEATPTS